MIRKKIFFTMLFIFSFGSFVADCAPLSELIAEHKEVAGTLDIRLKILQGNDQYCTLIEGGVWCWPENGYSDPVQPIGLGSGVTEISGNGTAWAKAQLSEICAIKNGALYCWSDHDYPVVVAGMESGVSALSFGNYNVYVVKGGELYSRGDNSHLQLGVDASHVSSKNFIPTGITGVKEIYASHSFACLKMNDGIYCLGKNEAGQLGMGSTGGSTDIPQKVVGVSALAQFPVGANDWANVCVLDSLSVTPDKPICWGEEFAATPALFNFFRSAKISKLRPSVPGDGFWCAVTNANKIQCTDDGGYERGGPWSPQFHGTGSTLKVLDFALTGSSICAITSEGLFCGTKADGLKKRSFPALESYLARFKF